MVRLFEHVSQLSNCILHGFHIVVVVPEEE
jgi:hypothetical protein